jgi:hypothetical protein
VEVTGSNPVSPTRTISTIYILHFVLKRLIFGTQHSRFFFLTGMAWSTYPTKPNCSLPPIGFEQFIPYPQLEFLNQIHTTTRPALCFIIHLTFAGYNLLTEAFWTFEVGQELSHLTFNF